MSSNSQFDRELDLLDEALASGHITVQQYSKQLRELQRDYQAAAEEAAQQAHDDELARW